VAGRVTRLLLDTSAVIANAVALALKPDQTAGISVITLGELVAGVKLAADPRTRALRQARLAAVRSAFDPIPVDEIVAERFGEILASARSSGRQSKATDLLIIATAAATGRILRTLDHAQEQLAVLVGVPTES
jgi:predicted nucleic acid-binding protein